MQIVSLFPLLYVLTTINKHIFQEGSHFQQDTASLLSYEKSVTEPKPTISAEKKNILKTQTNIFKRQQAF